MRTRAIAAIAGDFTRSHSSAIALIAIVVAAAILRVAALDVLPPALHADEAPNAWNAYTLLKTGMDQYGVHWPIFYTRAFGDNRSTLYIYMIMPFQALGGLNVWTTRLPAVFAALLTIVLIDYVGSRLFGRAVGLAAAGLLAFNPWHIQMSRWGHEASIVPLLVILPVAALLWANLPLGDEEREPRPLRAGLAGAAAGIVCYGYQVVRLFVPLFLVALLLMNLKLWWGYLKMRRGAASMAALVLAAALTFGPLLYKHLTDPEMGRRGQIQGLIWKDSDSAIQKTAKVFARYMGHYGPDFLFVSGDGDPALSPPAGFGLFLWTDLPLIVVGFFVCLKQARWSPASRLVLLWLVLYPAGDLLYQHKTLHALRSLPGLPAFVLLAAVGAVAASRWLWAHRDAAGAVVLYAAALLIFTVNVRFEREFFGADFSRQKRAQIVFAHDIFGAAEWLRMHLDEADAVFITGAAAHPDIVTLVALRYDPEKWFREPRELIQGPLKSGAFKDAYLYRRYGKIYFMFDETSLAALNTLAANGRPDRVIFIVRPRESDVGSATRPTREIIGAGDRVTLSIIEKTF
jgi:4-amino-4-deoxy-L-arabinose transferase-like glycosyltransferase